MTVYRCHDVDLATIADEQAEIRKLLAEVREALELRGHVMRAQLAMSITLSRAERVLADLVEARTVPRPSPTLGHGLEVAS